MAGVADTKVVVSLSRQDRLLLKRISDRLGPRTLVSGKRVLREPTFRGPLAENGVDETWSLPVGGVQYRLGWIGGCGGRHLDDGWTALALRTGNARLVPDVGGAGSVLS